MMKRRNWTREELILAFNLYCKLPFGSLHSRNPRIIVLSKIIGRTPNAVAFKLTNFASFDPYLQSRGIKGMKNAGKMDKEVWNEFANNWEDLIFESENILAKLQGKNKILSDTESISIDNLDGEDKCREIKTRVNQRFFRQVILNNYSHRCAICNINIPDLLIAGHIIPWSANKKERLNPQNGICFCSLHDKAFDRGLIGINDDYKVVISQDLNKMRNENYFSIYFGNFQNKPINLPEKFLPRRDFLQFHINNILR